MNPQLLLILSTALQAFAASFNETDGKLTLLTTNNHPEVLHGDAVPTGLPGSLDENEYFGYTFHVPNHL